jgi:hypothetical protein
VNQKQQPRNNFNQQNKLDEELTLTYRGRANNCKAKLSIKEITEGFDTRHAG